MKTYEVRRYGRANRRRGNGSIIMKMLPVSKSISLGGVKLHGHRNRLASVEIQSSQHHAAKISHRIGADWRGETSHLKIGETRVAMASHHSA